MTAPTVEDSAAYVAAVRAALADLPAGERDELLDDLEDHLAEVAAEDGGSLHRLGPADRYARELRASAGLPEAQPAAPRTARVRELRDRAAASGAARELAGALRDLGPVWWVVRAGAAFALAAQVVPLGLVGRSGLLPTFLGSSLLGLLLLGALVVLSLRLGRRADALSVGQRRLVLAGDLLTGVVALQLAGAVLSGVVSVHGPVTGAASDVPRPQYLGGVDGPISNIYPFDGLGRPLKDVQLFDQDGRPLSVLLRQAPDGSYAEPERRRDTAGAERRNVFPRAYRVDTHVEQVGPTTAPVAPPSVVAPQIVPARPANPRPAAAGTPPTASTDGAAPGG